MEKEMATRNEGSTRERTRKHDPTVIWPSGNRAKIKYHGKKCRSCKRCLNGGATLLRFPNPGKGTYRFDETGPIGFASEEKQLKRLKKFMRKEEERGNR